MLTIVIQVDAPPGQSIGVKEHLAMCDRLRVACAGGACELFEPGDFRTRFRGGG